MRERQRERERRTRRAPAPPLAPREAEPGRAPAAQEPEPDTAVLRLAIRTTASPSAGAMVLAATADTSVGEILDRACRELALGDPERHALVARGEVLGDRELRIGELTREGLGEEIAMRLVRRPEAGCRS